MTKDKIIPPQNNDAEEAVLGCILIDREAMAKSMQILNKEDFYKTENAIIYENMTF